jgi:uncharacterized repeat protein (TIGR01451 family)
VIFSGLRGLFPAWIIGISATCVFADFRVSSTDPAAGTNGVPLSHQIVIDFNDTLQFNSAGASNVLVRGELSGFLSATLSAGSLIIDPATNFSAGENVFVVLDDTLVSTNGVSLEAHSFHFHANSIGCTNFAYSNVESIGAAPASSQSIAVGDLDGANGLDAFVVINGGPDLVLTNDGTGTLVFHQSTAAADPSFGVALGDLDQDGDLDAVVATALLGADVVYMNDGTGNFTPNQTLGEDNCRDVALGDIDNDGDLDAVIVASVLGTNTVLTNDGSGTLSFAQALAVGAKSVAVEFADVDLDGYLDLVIADTSGAEGVYLNNGAGQFVLPQSLGSANGLDIGRINDDPFPDIVLASAESSAAAIYTNDGTGMFFLHTSVGNSAANDAALGDINGDGAFDVITANDDNLNQIWLNDGSGLFSAANISLQGSNSTGLALADLDGDADLEILVTNDGEPDQVFFQDGCFAIAGSSPSNGALRVQRSSSIDVTFTGPVSVNSANSTSFYVRGSRFGRYPGTFSANPAEVLTFTPDQDFIAGELIEVGVSQNIENPAGTSLEQGKVFQFYVLASGCPQFNYTNSSSTASSVSHDVDLVDFDDDGHLDAFVSNNGANRIWYNDGSGEFPVSDMNVGAGNSMAAAVGDVDADGRTDIVVANDGTDNIFFRNTNVGIITNVLSSSNLRSRDVAMGDLNQDGFLDVFIVNDLEENVVHLLDGGSFLPGIQLPQAKDSRAVDLGDLNADGYLDAFVVNYNNAHTVLLNNGDGSFTNNGQMLNQGFQSGDVQLGDLDGDGDLDAVVTHSLGFDRIYLNDGQGVFFLPSQVGTSPSAGVDLNDLDGDGDLDAMFAKAGPPDEIWLNNGSGSFVLAQALSQVGTSRTVALGDFDGDGDADAYVASSGLNEVYKHLGCIDLSVSKSVAPPIVTTGSNLVYTIVVTNQSFESVSSVVVTDSLPSMVTFDLSGSDPNCLETNGVVQCTLSSIPALGSATVTIAAVIGDTNVTGIIRNDVSVIPVGAQGEALHVDNANFATNTVRDTDLDGIADFADVDDDGDQMPDEFELSNGLDPLDAGDAGFDPDFDDVSNAKEYLAGLPIFVPNDSVARSSNVVLTTFVIDGIGGASASTGGVVRALIAGAQPTPLSTANYSQGSIFVHAPGFVHTTVSDIDGDGILDADDLDRDGDGVLNSNELANMTLDSDNDMLPNWFDADDDNDGIPDLLEWIGGTSATDPTSFFVVGDAESGSGGIVEITWDGLGNRLYAIEYLDTLISNDPWLILAENIPGTNGIMRIPDSGSLTNSSRAYRILVRPMP